MCSCATSDSLTLLLTLRKRLSVNQIRAASQTSPGVRCYRASLTMLHCSLHIAHPPQRSGGFQWGNHEVRRSPFVENNAEEFSSSCRWGELFVWCRAAVMTRWEVSDNCVLPSARIKPQPFLCAQISDYKSGFCQRGGFTYLCPSRVIPNIQHPFTLVLKVEIFIYIYAFFFTKNVVDALFTSHWLDFHWSRSSYEYCGGHKDNNCIIMYLICVITWSLM